MYTTYHISWFIFGMLPRKKDNGLAMYSYLVWKINHCFVEWAAGSNSLLPNLQNFWSQSAFTKEMTVCPLQHNDFEHLATWPMFVATHITFILNDKYPTVTKEAANWCSLDMFLLDGTRAGSIHDHFLRPLISNAISKRSRSVNVPRKYGFGGCFYNV